MATQFVNAARSGTAVPGRDFRPSVIADVVQTSSRRGPPPALVGFDGQLVVGIVHELNDHLLAYRGPEEPEMLDEFIRPATKEIDSALRVVLTPEMLAGGQAAAEAGTRLQRESETRLHSVSNDCFFPPTSNQTTQDAERHLQMFLGGCGYLDAFMLGREVAGRERLFASSPVLLYEDGYGSSARIADSAAALVTGSCHPADNGRHLPRQD